MAFAVSAFAGESTLVLRRSLQENAAEATDAGSFKAKYHLDRSLPIQVKNPNQSFPSPVREKQSTGELVTDPQGSVSRYAMAVDIFLSNMGAFHIGGFGANVITSDNGKTFYTKATTLNYFQQGFSAGEINGNQITFHTGQYIYDTYDNEKAYMYAAYLSEGNDWPEIVDEFVLTKDEKGRYVSSPGYYFMVLTKEEAERGIDSESNIICFGTNYVFTPLPENPVENKQPEDAEVFNTRLSANSLNDYGETVMKDITVGISGEYIYIGGLTEYLPDSYLVGKKISDNTFTFNTHQYLGYHDKGDYPYVYEFAMVNPIYFDGESLSYKETESVNMTFNEDKTLLTLEDGAGIFVNAYGDFNSWEELYWNMMIGDFDQLLTPKNPTGLACYGSDSTPYITFEWSKTSVEGMPMNEANLWCEVILNGKPYIFSPEYYEGLTDSSEKVYYNTSDVDGLYVGEFSTIYLNEFKGEFDKIKSLAVVIGYASNGETRRSDVVYVEGFEPFEDKAFIPSAPSNTVYYKDYYHKIRFKFDGKDTEGNIISNRILAVEILLDGNPLVFKDSEYFFNGGEGADVTMIGLKPNSINYSSSLVSNFGDEYVLSLWGHSDIPDFNRLAIRPVCTGGGTITYGECREIILDREATPANPTKVEYDEEAKLLKFHAMPIDTEGNGLSPEKYGYEVYVNDELYVFKAELYELDKDISVIPSTGVNYDLYLTTDYIYDETDWTCIDEKTCLSITMGRDDTDIKKIGVRAVYTDGNGNTTYSSIINSDGTTSVHDALRSDAPVKWFNLQGIEVTNPVPGSIYLRKQGATTTKVLVK